MPARVHKIRHDEETRAKIKAGNIINRLQKFIAGTIKMDPAAVTASLGLLKKVLPDLTSVEHSGEITTSKVIRTPAPSTGVESWQQQYSDQPKAKDLN